MGNVLHWAQGVTRRVHTQTPPPIYTFPQVVSDSLALHSIAVLLRKARFDGGALRLDNTKLCFKLDKDGNPVRDRPGGLRSTPPPQTVAA